MVRTQVDQLKADAFKLSKILATYKVKLSSQQCLDVLSRLSFNLPYEALLSKAPDSTGGNHVTDQPAGQALHEWLACATSFRDMFKTLSREGVAWAEWGKEAPLGSQEDGALYLRACGVAAERFSRIAEAFIQSFESFPFHGLTFTALAGDLNWEGCLATLRIQSLGHTGHSTGSQFVPIDLKQQKIETLTWGAESRIVLRPALPLPGLESHPFQPSVDLSYTVAGQNALKGFASVLQESGLQGIWAKVGKFDVETRISLMKDDAEECIDEDWTTDNDPEGKRLLAFCVQASRLSDEETSNWPPYLCLTRRLDSTNTHDDLENYFMAICAHASCLVAVSTHA